MNHSSPALRQSISIEVSLGDRSYPIRISSGQPDQIAANIQSQIPDLTHAVIIVDQAVLSNWAEPIATSLEGSSVRVTKIVVPPGETSKSIQQMTTVWNDMLAANTDRRSVVIAVGGGVIGDLAGFAASSFTRGLRFVQVPTTLLAMVDSSVGGKTGINLPGAKNMVGAFWQPTSVEIDTDVLSTMPQRSYLSGLAEVIKYGVIDDAEFFEWLEANAKRLVQREAEAMRHAIAKSCECKARVVAEDERETSGRRATLNYGHTFAHAIEATAGYGEILHGEAVSIGMQMAAHLACQLKLCQADLLERQQHLLSVCGLPLAFPDANIEAMLAAMGKDKKVAHGQLRFILPTKIGHVALLAVDDSAAVRNAIEACRSDG
ncbi:MAG: 3-dehydroquinate synthase [Planctomycetota bacterium]